MYTYIYIHILPFSLCLELVLVPSGMGDADVSMIVSIRNMCLGAFNACHTSGATLLDVKPSLAQCSVHAAVVSRLFNMLIRLSQLSVQFCI